MERTPKLMDFAKYRPDIVTLIESAESEVLSGRLLEACQILLKANSIDSSNLMVCTKLGHCYLLLGNLEMSYSCYCRIIQEGTGPAVEEAWYGLANLYLKQIKYQQAEAAFKTVIALNPSFEMASTVYLKLATIYKKTGNPQRAIAFFKAASHYKDLMPDQINELLIQLGSCFELTGNRKTAGDLYLEAVSLKKSAKNIVCVAWILIKTQKFDKAQSLLSKAIKLTPDSSKEYHDIQFIQALCHFKSKQLADCSKLLTNLLTLYPNEPYYLACFGILEENLNKYSSALGYLWRAAGLLPERYDILYSIGQIYEKLGMLNEAIFLYTRIIEMHSWHESSKIRLRECQVGLRTVLPPLDIVNIDITEFPFHKSSIEKDIALNANMIAVPKPIYSGMMHVQRPFEGFNMQPRGFDSNYN